MPKYPELRSAVEKMWHHLQPLEQDETTASYDPIERPLHYNSNPSGIECIDVVEHLNFCRGNAIKYIWRAGLKDDAIQDLEKARWYIEREIARIKEEKSHG